MQSITEMILHAPWWAPTLLVALGVFVFFSGNRRQEKNTQRFGAIIALLGVALGLVSYLVDTPIEKALKGSKQLVYAVAGRDWKTAEGLLDPHCTLTVFNAFTIYHSRDEIMPNAKIGVERYGIKAVHITHIEARETNPIITVTLDVISEQDATMGRPIPSSWQFEWRKRDADWTLMSITNLRIADQTGTGASAQFPRP